MARRKTEGRADLILDSSLELFAKHGFSKTTIADIAKAAEVASGTIYLYYSSKEEILKACAQRFHTHHKNFVKSLLATDKGTSLKLREYLLNRHAVWEKETIGSTSGSDLASVMISIAPEITKAEQSLWLETLRTLLKEGETKNIYHFSSLTQELKIFLHCLTGFFPLPGIDHPFAPTKRDLVEAIDWFDKKWRVKT
ncbi:MAG: TetR/AcrR family transcriptional regulator [Bdellovibrionaceae bacterium]|nr:TetR/AcrR family transcriptional regulator [Pseudobdellovibrionaceae bacterium]